MPPVLPGDNAKECADEAKGKASDVHNLYAVRGLHIVERHFNFYKQLNFFPNSASSSATANGTES